MYEPMGYPQNEMQPVMHWYNLQGHRPEFLGMRGLRDLECVKNKQNVNILNW